MSQYVHNDYGRRRRRKGSTLFMLADGVMLLLSVVTAVAMFLTYLAPYVTPARMWIFPILGLIAPAVYIATLIFALYWIIRWRKAMASVMTVLVVIGLFKVPLFLGIDLKRDYGEQQKPRGAIKVMTYNVRMFFGADQHNSAAEVARFIKTVDPDILCIQEMNFVLTSKTDFDSLMSGYSMVLWQQEDAKEVSNSPLIIYTKFPVICSGSVTMSDDASDSNVRSMWADLTVGDDTLRVFNNHLHSTAITAKDDEFLTSRRILSDTASDVKLRSIVRRFKDNSILRAEQADTISQAIASTPYAKIVCGDFNDTPMSYVYRKMTAGLDDAFCSCGSVFSHTYKGFFNTLRIDYVLYSPALECLSYEVNDEVYYSDHYPVVVSLKYK